MAITRDYRVVYTARNAITGLTNVTAKVRRNGAYVLGTGVTPLPLVELDNGRYELVLSAAQLNLAGGAGFYDFYINSATKDAPATKAEYITEKNEDDLETHLGAIETKVDSIQADTNDIQTNLASVKATVESTNTEVISPLHGLAQLKSYLDAIQSAVSNIQNSTRFVATIPDQLVRPETGLRRYRSEIRLFDTAGNMEDPDANTITVSIKDESGNSRNSYLVGSVAGSTVDATRDAQGIFHVDLDIPDTADIEQLSIYYNYNENGLAQSQVRTTQVLEEVQASGLALEATSQDILLDTADMQPRVLDIQSKVNDANYGLSALKTLLDAITIDAQDSVDYLTNATFGLSALKTLIDTKASQASITALDTKIENDVLGTGHVSATDSLKGISDRIFYGGSIA
jgi:hypothetical protein